MLGDTLSTASTPQSLLAILLLILPMSLHLPINRRSHPNQPHNPSHNTVGDLAFLAVVRQAQTEAAVDDAESD